jgi:hypothetical protein
MNFEPQLRIEVGTYDLLIRLSDSGGLYSQYYYTLKVVPAINRSPPIFSPVLDREIIRLALGEIY